MPAANIIIRSNGNFQGQGEGSLATGFRYMVTPPKFKAGTTEGRLIVIENQTNHAVAVSLPVPIGNDIAQPIAAGQQLTLQINAAFEDEYPYTVMVNEGGTIFRAHAGSNPKIVYP
jgi:hypothetical protein